jgi:hypothetical protein
MEIIMELSLYLPESDSELSHLRYVLSSSKSLEIQDIDGFVKVLGELRSNRHLRYNVEDYSSRFGGKLYNIIVKCVLNSRIQELYEGRTIDQKGCLTKLIAYLHKIGVSQTEINANMKTYASYFSKATASMKRSRKRFLADPRLKNIVARLQANSLEGFEFMYLKKKLELKDEDFQDFHDFITIVARVESK